MTKVRITTISFAVTFLAVVATGQAHAAEKAPALSGNGCLVQVTGAVNTSWKGAWLDTEVDQSGNVGAVTDYWLSDLDLTEDAEALAGPGEDKAKKVLQVMRRNPRFSILLLNCMNDEGRIFIRPTVKSSYQDIPHKARSYKIVAERTTAPGQFVARNLKVGKTPYRVTEGRLDIRKFNFKRVVGTFSLKATPVNEEDRGKDINVEGAFNFPCTGIGSRCTLK